MFSFNFFILLFFLLFFLGLLGILLNKRNLLIILMSIELMLVSINLNFIFFSIYFDDLIGQLFAIFILTVAAAESAIGLAIFSLYFQDKKSIFLETFIRGRG